MLASPSSKAFGSGDWTVSAPQGLPSTMTGTSSSERMSAWRAWPRSRARSVTSPTSTTRRSRRQRPTRPLVGGQRVVARSGARRTPSPAACSSEPSSRSRNSAGGLRRQSRGAPPRRSRRPSPARGSPRRGGRRASSSDPTCCAQRSRSAAPLRAERGGIAARSSSAGLDEALLERRGAVVRVELEQPGQVVVGGARRPARWCAPSSSSSERSARSAVWSSTWATKAPAPLWSSRAVAGYSSIE